MASLLKSKTFWAGVAGLIGATAGYFSGQLTPNEAIAAAFASIQTIFIRDAIRKAAK